MVLHQTRPKECKQLLQEVHLKPLHECLTSHLALYANWTHNHSCKSLTQEKIHHYFPFYYPTTIFALHVDTFEVSIRVCSPNNKEKRDNPPGIFFIKKLSPTKKNYSMMSVTRNSLLSVCPWRVGIWFGWGLPSTVFTNHWNKQMRKYIYWAQHLTHQLARWAICFTRLF